MITPYLHWIGVACVVWEVFLVKLYDSVVKLRPDWALGVILGSKLFKMLIVIIAIATVKYLTDLPVKKFALVILGAYTVTIVFETVYFLYKKKQNGKN